MMNDIFIDNNIACRFSNPMDKEMVKLIDWLVNCKSPEDKKAVLVISKKLLNEYHASCRDAQSNTSIPVIIGTLQQEGRLRNISNNQIKDFQSTYFTKAIQNKLQSNNEDRNHIPVVLLSDRKFALTLDRKFATDLINFPGFKVTVSDRPEKIPYNK